MTMERYIRAIAGVFIVASVALSQWHHPYWLFFTAFVGLNLLQSAFTRWCLMEDILKKFGVPK
jgi:pterin-4a-carbinolamine dehydratase